MSCTYASTIKLDKLQTEYPDFIFNTAQDHDIGEYAVNYDVPVHGCFDRICDRHGDRVCIVEDNYEGNGKRLDYNEVRRMSEGLAACVCCVVLMVGV